MSSVDGLPTEPVRLTEVVGGRVVERLDEAVVEEPLEIRVAPGDRPGEAPVRLAVTMRTPGSDFELAIGFLATEGIVGAPRDVARIAYCTDPAEPRHHNIVTVTLAPGVAFDLDRLRRNFFTSSSCGVCGKAAIEHLRTRIPRRAEGRFRVPGETLRSLPSRAAPSQRTFGRTGGLHAAALFRPDGELLALREDVGRHNAVDKLIGGRLLAGTPWDDRCVLLVTGRAGFELVQKAAVAGIPFLAAVGAPSTLAIDLAREQGMTLVGFLREGRFNVYTGVERVAPSGRQSTNGT